MYQVSEWLAPFPSFMMWEVFFTARLFCLLPCNFKLEGNPEIEKMLKSKRQEHI